MREMTVREAHQNFSRVIAAVERGETIVITKNGTRVAKISPQAADRSSDPEWQSAFVPAQVLGEFIRFIQRRAPNHLDEAARQTAIYRAAFLTPATADDIVTTAAELARAHHVQFWHAVVCAASAQAGAKALLSEDMQDGRLLDTVLRDAQVQIGRAHALVRLRLEFRVDQDVAV